MNDNPVDRSVPVDDDDERLERIRAGLQAYATEFLLLVTPKGELVATREAVTLGYEGQERAGHHIAEHLHPDDLPKVFEIIERARRTRGFRETLIARARHKDGSWRVFEATVIEAMDDLGGAVLRVRDVTDEHRPGDATMPAPGGDADRFLSLTDMLPIGVLSADRRGWVAFCSDNAEPIFNLPKDQLLGHGWEQAVLAEDRPDVAHATGQVLTTGVPQQVTFRITTGWYERWVHAKFVPLGTGPRWSGWLAAIEDVTDRRRAESRLAHQATHDALTGLPNRALLEDRLRQACARLRRDTDSVTVLFIDLDRFKEVNDTLGHQAGDAVLIEVARRFRGALRDVDTIARLGGDEFVAVCEALPTDEIDLVVGRLADALAVPLLVEGRQVVVGASIGVTTTSDVRADVADLLVRADQAMYKEKQERHDATG